MTSLDFEENYITQEYKPYEDNVGGAVRHTNNDDDEPTPITFIHYLGAKVVLLKGDEMVAAEVIRRKIDSEE